MRLLPSLHAVDEREKLAAVDYFYEWLSDALVRYHVNRWRVIQPNAIALGSIRFYERCEFSLWIDGKGKLDLTIGPKLLRKGAQVIFRNLELALEDGVAELVAQFFRVRIEITGEDRRIVRPGVHRQRIVVTYHRDVVILGGFFQQRRSPRAIRTLEILEYDNGDLRPLGGLQNWVVLQGRVWILSQTTGYKNQRERDNFQTFLHKKCRCKMLQNKPLNLCHYGNRIRQSRTRVGSVAPRISPHRLNML